MVQAAYATAPIAELPACNSRPTAEPPTSARATIRPQLPAHNWLPKVGLVYSLNNKTVIRGGYGMYADTLNVANNRPNTTGFNQPTSTPISNNSGMTFC